MGTVFGLTAGRSVLVVAAHPDDETLGSGGTIARLADEGMAVHVLVAIVRAIPQATDCSDPKVRIEELEAACHHLGVAATAVALVDPDEAINLDACHRRLVRTIEADGELSLAALRPDVLLIPAASALHQDHLAVHRAAFAAARIRCLERAATPRIVLGVRGPEDHWSVHPEPWTVHVDTSRYWPAKERALGCYASQMHPAGHPRSVDHVRTLDAAAGGFLGWTFAEVFTPYRVAF